MSYILRENTYPFLGLVVLKQSRLVVCERVEGAVPLDDLISRLRASMMDNEGELVVERTERMRRLEDQQLRKAQDEAFLESLEADREKERRREEDQSRAKELAREQQRLQQEEEKEKAVSCTEETLGPTLWLLLDYRRLITAGFRGGESCACEPTPTRTRLK